MATRFKFISPNITSCCFYLTRFLSETMCFQNFRMLTVYRPQQKIRHYDLTECMFRLLDRHHQLLFKQNLWNVVLYILATPNS